MSTTKIQTRRFSAMRDQLIALSLTVVVCAVLIFLLWSEIVFLNQFIGEKIVLKVRITDILVGLTIYLKTSIDFAIFIGRLMAKNPGLKGRIGIEIGTAFGNAIGTMAILLIWAFFKEVIWLLAIMIFLAALVLLRLAEDSVEHIDANDKHHPRWFNKFTQVFKLGLGKVNRVLKPFLSRIIPSHTLKVQAKAGLIGLLTMSFTVPFILGLDDFAGYVPLFSIINVFGFGIGVFVGHMILNIFLYISPDKTIKIVKNPVISILGGIAFVLLAIWGIWETVELLLHHYA